MAQDEGESENSRPRRFREHILAAGFVGLAAAPCLALRDRLQTTDVAMVLLAAVVAVASRYPLGSAVFASILSILVFDFVFVPPYYTLAVHDTAYFITFAVMLAVAVTMSRLTSRIRAQADAAAERERRTAALYELNRELAATRAAEDQLAAVERHMRLVSGTAVEVVLLSDQDRRENHFGLAESGMLDSAATRIAAAWAHSHGEPAGAGTPHCAEAEALVVPLRTPAGGLGVALVARGDAAPTAAVQRTITGLAEQAALALERTTSALRHEASRIEVEAERLRTALLSSLSHDLRSPLGAIEGAASSLAENRALPAPVRTELAETIVEEAHRMSRLISNLLDMMRLETGALTVQKAWQPLEETLGVALVRLDDRLASHPVSATLPGDLPLVPIDDLLIEQLFINLLENAAKHTPPGTAIRVSAWALDGEVTVEVADEGPGLPPGEEEAVFRKFYRSGSTTAKSGSGLGLTICRGIVAAHGGRIWATSPASGGAAFRFTLPLDGVPPSPPPLEAGDP